jgi:hypothetical protein
MKKLLFVVALIYSIGAVAQMIKSESQVGKGDQRYARIINRTDYKLSCTIADRGEAGNEHIFMVFGSDKSQWYPVSDDFEWSCGCGIGKSLSACVR